MDKSEKRNEVRISYQIEIIIILRKGKRTITEIANMLGISFTAIIAFGNSYLDLIRKDINEFSSSEIRTRIVTSGLDDKCSTLGVGYQAASIYFKDMIENSTEERFGLLDYVLEEKYREL